MACTRVNVAALVLTDMAVKMLFVLGNHIFVFYTVNNENRGQFLRALLLQDIY